MSQSWARSPEGRILTKRGVPDGSCEFQRALDYFLSASDSDDEDQTDGVDHNACAANRSGTPEILLIPAEDDNDSVNQINGDISVKQSCDKIKSFCKPSTNITSLDVGHDTIRLGRGESSDSSYRLSPVGAVPNTKNGAGEIPHGDHSHSCEENKRRGSSPVKLPSITAHLSQSANNSASTKLNMGSNCSTNITHATGDFSSVIPHSVLSSRGNGSQLSICTCNHNKDSSHWAVRTNKNAHIASSTTSSHTKPGSEFHHSLRPQGNLRSTDSSPQRLLPKRSHSFNSHSVSPTKKSIEHKQTRVSELIANDGEMRGRSHSWSNSHCGKKISKHSPVSIRSGGHCSNETGQNGPSIALESLESDKDTTSMTHLPGCPLYHETARQDTGSAPLGNDASQTMFIEDLDEDLHPLLRKRAASESHTTLRSQQAKVGPSPLAYRKTCDGETPGVNHHDFHVHWADEENLSLSTSVILTRIRPRSYSHGAVDNMPHRPILKKVSGL